MLILADDPIESSAIRAGTIEPSTYEEARAATIEESMIRSPLHSIGRMMMLGEAITDETSPQLTEDEWKNSEYFRPGLKYPASGKINRETARLLAFARDEERKRSEAIESYKGGIASKTGLLALDMATQMLDPINVGASLIPIGPLVGMGKVGTTIAGTTAKLGFKTAVKRGAVEGAVGNLLVEPFVYGAAEAEQSQTYGLGTAALNVAAGGVLGGMFGAGGVALRKVIDGTPISALGNIVSSTTERSLSEFMDELSPKVRVAAVRAAEEFVDDLSPEGRVAAVRAAAGQVMNDEAVSVEPVVKADQSRTGKIPERDEFIASAGDKVNEENISIFDTAAKYADDDKVFWQNLSTKNVDDFLAVDAALKKGDIDSAVDAMARVVGGDDLEVTRVVKEEIEAAMRGEVGSPYATILKNHWEKVGNTAEVKPKGEKSASVKAFITKADEARLKGMGYTDEEIYKMSPQKAEEIFNTKASFEKVRDVPAPERSAAAEVPEPKDILGDDIEDAIGPEPERTAAEQDAFETETLKIDKEIVRVKENNDALFKEIDNNFKSGLITEEEYRSVINELAKEDAVLALTRKQEGEIDPFIELIRCFIS